MGKVKSAAILQNAEDLDQLKRFVGAFCDEIAREFNGRVTFGDNIRASGPTVVAFTAAGVQEVIHDLNAVPTGFIIINKSATCDVWQASTTWTETKIYLQSSAAANVTIFVI